MKRQLKIKLAVIVSTILLGGYLLWPSAQRALMSTAELEALRGSDPAGYQKLEEGALNLGLDLQGGMHLLLRVRTEDVLDKELDALVHEIRDELGREGIPVLDVYRSGGRIEAGFGQPELLERAHERLERTLGRGYALAHGGKPGKHLLIVTPEPESVRRTQEDAFAQVIETLRQRVDELGISERVVRRYGLSGHRILVELPGVRDPEQAKRVLGKVAQLELRIVLASAPDKETLLRRYPAGCRGDALAGAAEAYLCPDGSLVLPGELPAAGAGTVAGYYHLEGNVPAAGRDLAGAQLSQDEWGQPAVAFTVKRSSAEAFGRLTRENLGRQLAIVLDGRVKSAPILEGGISRSGQIRGSFTAAEAYELALTLRSGALPAGVEYLEQRTVRASLGQDSIDQGYRAFAAGAFLVAAFMLLYYRWAGLIAVVALLASTLFILAMLAANGAALTLPGIAGLVLTLGMAVDANVVIYERIRDELGLGKSVRAAIRAGFDKAFSAIADANVTTFIAAMVLLQFGTGPVRGFGVTLAIGIAATMFSALFVSRTLFELAFSGARDAKLRFRSFVGETRIRFFRWRKLAAGVSIGIIAAGLLAMAAHRATTGSAMSWGVDFAGGTLLQVRFDQPVELGEVRKTLKDAGLDPALQELADANELIVRTPESGGDVALAAAPILEALQSGLGPRGIEVEQRRLESVGPQVGAELKEAALWALGIAVLCTLVYLGLRFELPYALGAVVASFHDVLVLLAFFAVFRLEVGLTFVAALLTIFGYSLNDTIVIFDRVRENRKRLEAEGFEHLIDVSLNETLSRTVLTSLTTLFATLALLLLGGAALEVFATAMLVGVVAGCYSTVYVAAPVVHVCQQWQEARRTRVRKAS
jgi:SecD/SecF fusion protein